MDRYILDSNGKPVPEPDLEKWGMWFECNENRIVAQEFVGDVKVSTVFLALDHSYDGKVPILWETMVFGGEHNTRMDRCSGNREQAEAMHQKMVKLVRG